MKLFIVGLLTLLLSGCGDFNLTVKGSDENVTELENVIAQIKDCESIGKQGVITMWSTVAFSGPREYSLASNVVCKPKE